MIGSGSGCSVLPRILGITSFTLFLLCVRNNVLLTLGRAAAIIWAPFTAVDCSTYPGELCVTLCVAPGPCAVLLTNSP